MNASPAELPKKKRFFSLRTLRVFFFLGVCTLTLVAAFYAEEDWRGAHAWNQFRDEWQSRGEKFQWSDFVPPPVPDGENFFMSPFFEDAVTQAFGAHTNHVGIINRSDESSAKNNVPWQNLMESLRAAHRLGPFRVNQIAGVEQPPLPSWYDTTNLDLAAWQKYYRAGIEPSRTRADLWNEQHPGIDPARQLALEKIRPTNEFPATVEPQSPAQDTLFALDVQSNALAELRDAAKRPNARFPVHYEDGSDAYLPHLAKLKAASIYLRLRSASELTLDKTNSAAQDVDLIFVLGDSLRTEPIGISFLVRCAINDILFSAIKQGLSQHVWSDAQLSGFQEKLAQQNLSQHFLLALRGDRGRICTELDDLGAQSIFGPLRDDYFVSNFSTPEQYFFLRFAPRGQLDGLKQKFSTLVQEREIAAVVPETGRINLELFNGIKTDPCLNQKTVESSILNYIFHPPDFGIQIYGEQYARNQTGLNFAIIACALERYRIANGNYPAHLEQLKPLFIEEIPVEVATGAFYACEITSDGSFKLKSTLTVGSDHQRNLSWSYP